jgi:DNA-binding CsgD family transcriptional regulator
MICRYKQRIFALIGASVYWGANITSFAGWIRPDQMAFDIVDSQIQNSGIPIASLAITAIMFICMVTSDFFQNKKVTNCVAIVTCGTNLIYAAIYILIDFAPTLPLSQTLSFFVVILGAISSSGLILLWGLWFACLGKPEAAQMVVPVTLLSLLIYYLSIAIFPSEIVGSIMTPLYFSISAILFLLSRFTYKRTPRDLNTKKLGSITGFFLSRVCIGLVIGQSIQLLPVGGQNSMLLPSLLIGVAIVSLILVWHFKYGREAFRLLPLMPLLGTGFLLLPYFPHEMPSLAGATAPIIWFCWIILSSFQISGIIDAYGIDEARLSFSEKAVVMLSSSIGTMIAPSISLLLPIETSSSTSGFIAIALVYITVLATTAAIWHLVYERKQGELVEELSKPHEEQLKQLYDSIAKNHRLSVREREVLEMLAQGHTRKYIQDSLLISDGTTKSHIAHVYQKLNVHKKEELYSLIEDYKSKNMALR